MRNGDKIRDALQRAYPDALINVYNDFSAEEVKIYFNGTMIARFKSIFWDEDFDNPKIEIKVKAPIKSIKEFIDFASNYETIRGALERGFTKWENESHPNS